MKTKAEILQLLKCYKSTAQKKYGMTKIGIFGSVARGEQKEGSDVDVYYEGEAPSFLT
jgi:predicted nucleotidyltransferase